MRKNESLSWSAVSVEKILGQGGGSAIVVKGRLGQPFRAKKVALKLITTSMCMSKHLNYEQEKENLLQEVKMIEAVTSGKVQNTLQKLAVVEGNLTDAVAKQLGILGRIDDPAVGIAMDYFDGISLYNFLHSQSHLPLSMEEKLRILFEIMTAIADMHWIGLIHGDIKTANVLINYTSRPHQVRVIDFGLSKFNDKITSKAFALSTVVPSTGLKGTRLYCAAEMLVHNYEASRSTDMYAFAMVAWEILSRRNLYEEYNTRNIRELEQLVIGGTRPSLESLPPDTPVAVREMMVKCWDGDRMNRQSSVECVSILTQAVETYESGMCDIFLSHASQNKPFLSFVHRLLCAAGKRVWMDTTDWQGHDLKEAMRAGIKKSKVVVVCLNNHFLTRESCVFEVEEAAEQQKPVLVLLLEKKILKTRKKHNVLSICNLKNKMYVDISEIASQEAWYNGQETEEMKTELSQGLEPLFKRLEDIAEEEQRKREREEAANRLLEAIQVTNDRIAETKRKSEQYQKTIETMEGELQNLTEQQVGVQNEVNLMNLEISVLELKLFALKETRNGKDRDLKQIRTKVEEKGNEIKVMAERRVQTDQSVLQHEETVQQLQTDLQTLLSEEITNANSSNAIERSRSHSQSSPNSNQVERINNTHTSLLLFENQRSFSGHTEPVSAIVQLHDGKIASSSWDKTIKIWNPNKKRSYLDISSYLSGECEATLVGHNDRVKCLIALQDKRIASASDDKTIKIWNVDTRMCEITIAGLDSYVNCLMELTDQTIASGSYDSIKIWHPPSRKCVITLEGQKTGAFLCFVELPDQKIASGSHENAIKIWNLISKQCEMTLEGHSDSVSSLVLLTDGRLVSGSNDKTIKLWNLSSRQCERTFLGHASYVNCLIALHEEGRIASGSDDNTIKVWNLRTGLCEVTLEGHSWNVTCLIHLKDKRLASGSFDKSLKLWSPEL